jgi:hypothetical protein
VAAFGAYAAALLLIGIASFRDCPEDAAALQKVRRLRGGVSLVLGLSTPPVSPSSLPFWFALSHRPPLQDIAAARADLVKRGVLDASG